MYQFVTWSFSTCLAEVRSVSSFLIFITSTQPPRFYKDLLLVSSDTKELSTTDSYGACLHYIDSAISQVCPASSICSPTNFIDLSMLLSKSRLLSLGKITSS